MTDETHDHGTDLDAAVSVFARSVEAEVTLRRFLRDAGVDAVVQVLGPDDLGVRFTARWPFPL